MTTDGDLLAFACTIILLGDRLSQGLIHHIVIFSRVRHKDQIEDDGCCASNPSRCVNKLGHTKHSHKILQ